MNTPSTGEDAGAAGAAPASSSADPASLGARAEMDRIRRRWSELPMDRAEAAVPLVRALVEEVAHRTAPGSVVPDLGPAALVDQLAVVVWDACADGTVDGLEAALTELRRALP